MILVIDIGNTNICFSLVKDNIEKYYRFKSSLDKSYDEYYLLFKQFLKDNQIDDIIISSVVPVITSKLVKLFTKYYDINPKIIGNKLKTGINIIADDPKSVGADLISDVAGAMQYYNECLIIDLGTASKFIYAKNNTLCGVSIAPGVSISTKTLIDKAALLPNFELIAPKKVLNNSTIPAMQSGVIFGYASMVDGMINRIKKETGNNNLKVIGTGGLINTLADNCENKFDIIDEKLTLKGIYSIYKKNI